MSARLPQFESRITNRGRPGPPLCGGTPPATPPCSDATVPARPQPPSQRQPYRRHRACAAPAVRITNHESRTTAVPALPCAGGLPPQRPPVAMPPCVPVPKLVWQRPVGNATVRARNQLVCQSRREYVTVSARFQLAANAPRTPHHHACAAPAVRITNHESRIPALPCGEGHPPQRPPVYATVPARFQAFLAASATMPTSVHLASYAVRVSTFRVPSFGSSWPLTTGH